MHVDTPITPPPRGDTPTTTPRRGGAGTSSRTPPPRLAAGGVVIGGDDRGRDVKSYAYVSSGGMYKPDKSPAAQPMTEATATKETGQVITNIVVTYH